MRVVVVPQFVLSETWRAFHEGAEAGVESTVRWACPVSLARNEFRIVTTVVNPRQRVSPGNFEIPHEGTRAMGEALRKHALVNIAQLHTHPGRGVGHSSWDDLHAFSSRDGALSIVWPNYGSGLPAIDDWGVHESRAGRWVRLRATEARRRIQFVPDLLRLRGPLDIIDPLSEHELENEWE